MIIISPTKNLWNNLGAQRNAFYSTTTDRTLTDRVWRSSNKAVQTVADSLYISNLTVGKTYTLSFEITSISLPAASSAFFISDRANAPDRSAYGTIPKTVGRKTLTFTASTNLLVIQCYLSYTLQPAGSCYFEIHDIQVEEGSTATDYVLPYVEEKIAGPQVKFPDIHVSSYSASAAPPITLNPGLYRLDWTFTGGTNAGARDYILPVYRDGEVDYANAVSGPRYTSSPKRWFRIKNKPLRWFYFYGGTGNTSADYTNIVLTMIEQTEEII